MASHHLHGFSSHAEQAASSVDRGSRRRLANVTAEVRMDWCCSLPRPPDEGCNSSLFRLGDLQEERAGGTSTYHERNEPREPGSSLSSLPTLV
jgi:hypothetical protein